MLKDDVERWALQAFDTTKTAGFSALKSTVTGTCHIGKFSGNRLNSSTLRSQLLFCLSGEDWNNTDTSVKKLLHEDQRIFVQVGEDVWDVYKGVGYDEMAQPTLWRQISGLQSFLSDLNNLDLASPHSSHGVFKSRQLIRYGAPGTGKSFGLDGETGDAVVFRTTFHPDSDYSTFVGAYKPTMKGEGADERISYSFRPQAFMNAYVSAWSNLDKNVVLVIEEINRGNCAQIFGDLFQLLDRGEDGYSMYPIDADADLAKWLAADDQFGRLNAGGADGDADGGSRGREPYLGMWLPGRS